MELRLKSPAMTLFFLQILVFIAEVVHTLVRHSNQVAKNLSVSLPLRCSDRKHSLCFNQLPKSHITLEELEKISQTKIIFYTKHFRKELNATKCPIQHKREKWHCGHNEHSSIDHTITGITSDLVNSAEQCRSLAS